MEQGLMWKQECVGQVPITRLVKKRESIVRCVLINFWIFLEFFNFFYWFLIANLCSGVQDDTHADRTSEKMQSAICYAIDGDQVNMQLRYFIFLLFNGGFLYSFLSTSVIKFIYLINK